MKISIILLLALSSLQLGQSLQLFLTEGKEKCIFDDVPTKELVVGYYHLLDALPGVDPSDVTQGITVTAYDPDGSTVLTKLARGEGKFSFKTQMSKEYS